MKRLSTMKTDVRLEPSAPVSCAGRVHIAGAINTLSNVPAFDWSYGCSATSAAMLFGYYDRTGYSDMYTGPTNGGVCPLDNSIWGHTVWPSVTCGECPLSVTHNGKDGRTIKGHVDDYWIDYGAAGPDPCVGNWTEHTLGDCTGDYMGTNQWKYGSPVAYNQDGGTLFYIPNSGDPAYDFTGYEPTIRDGCHGMRLFAESRGYTVVTNFSQRIKGQGTDPTKGFTFADFQAEIDAGHPVLIQVTGHTMLGYGYDTAGNTIYIHDTWDYSDHTMTWGGTYSGLQHKAVTVIRLQAFQYEHYNPTSNGWGGLGQNSWRAQTFTAMSNHSVTSVKIRLARNMDSIPGTVTVSIRETDGSGHPAGPDLAIGTTDGNTLPTGPTELPGEWREITFGTPCNLIGGTKYAIVVRALDATYASPLLWHHKAPPAYTDGNFEMSDDGGSTWSASDYDLLFEVWGN